MAYDYQAIDAVVNIWTAEALSHRPAWTDEFFVGKVKGKHDSAGISLEQMLAGMDAANIEYAFLVAAKSGRVGLPGCYHMPPQVVADAVAKYPDRFFGLVGIERPDALGLDDFGQLGVHALRERGEIALLGRHQLVRPDLLREAGFQRVDDGFHSGHGGTCPDCVLKALQESPGSASPRVSSLPQCSH